MQGARRALAVAAAAVLAALIPAPVLAGDGLPSFSKGVFHNATIGYYLEAASLLVHDGWWTRCWCGGFQDLVRFYPPLGNLVLAALLKATGSVSAAAGAGMALALAALVAGTVVFARELAGADAVPVALLSLVAVEAWVSTIAVYWEYTRLLGDGLALASLAYLARAVAGGSEEDAVRAGLIAGIVALTSLISALWLAAAAVAVITYAATEVLRRTPYAAGSLVRLVLVYVTAATAVSAWWLVPAAVPWGISHYLRVGAPLATKLELLLQALQLDPPLYMAVIQGPLAAATLPPLLLSRRRGPTAWAALAVALEALLYGQGLRLVPVVGLFLVLAAWEATHAMDRRGVLLAIVLAGVLVVYAIHYYPAYMEHLLRDHSFAISDEYMAAAWLDYLAAEGHSVRVYAMYGPMLHGNQWLNVFSPRVEQTLSGFMEGCLNEKVWRLDRLVKESLDYRQVYRLLLETGTDYLLVDRAWLRSTRVNSVVLLESHGLIEPVDEVNRVLNYSILYRVVGASHVETAAGEQAFWTPARLLGILTSLLTGAALRRMWRKMRG